MVTHIESETAKAFECTIEVAPEISMVAFYLESMCRRLLVTGDGKHNNVDGLGSQFRTVSRIKGKRDRMSARCLRQLPLPLNGFPRLTSWPGVIQNSTASPST